MSWLDQLQPASWRGVPFEVDSVDIRGGDNVVLREYPFADQPTVFRMGAAAETIRFSAYVIGADYQARRDALIDVLTGEGVLVHPTAGAMRAFVADAYKLTEAPLREGTVVRFELTFVRAEPRTRPQVQPSSQRQATAAAQAAKAAAVDQFASEFSLATAPAWVEERVVDRIQQATDGVWSRIKTVTAGINEYTDQIVGTYQVLRDGLTEIAATPAALAGSVRDLFALPTELAEGAAASFQAAYQSVFGLGSSLRKSDFETVRMASPGVLAMYGAGDGSALGLDTQARAQLAAMSAAVDNLVDTMAVASFVEAVAADELAGYEQVVAHRRWLYESCTALMARASTAPAPLTTPATSVHDALMQLLTTGLSDMTVRGADRARLTAYVPKVCMSIWQLSYLLYGTAAWADEIMSNNPHITHPLLVPAGLPVRVVQHG